MWVAVPSLRHCVSCRLVCVCVCVCVCVRVCVFRLWVSVGLCGSVFGFVCLCPVVFVSYFTLVFYVQ